MRRRIKPRVLSLSLALAFSVGLLACTTQLTPPSTKLPSATLYTAAKVLTMDASNSLASAVAVADGKIIAVGDAKAIQETISDYQFVLDKRFADKVIMPGFIDNHLHPALAGILLPATFITPFDWSLPDREVVGVQSPETYIAALKAAHRDLTQPQEMLITWGYHEYFHGAINRATLDSISRERPIVVWQRSFHEVFLNTAAMRALDLDLEGLGQHPAVDIEKGHFWETGLFAIFPKLAPIVLEPKRMMEGMRLGLLHAQMNGITTVADQGVPLMNLDMEMELLQQTILSNELPISMLVIGNGKTLGLNRDDHGLAVMETLPNRNNAQIEFLPKQVKLLADGAFYSQLMQMEEAYLDGHHGEWIMPPAELEAAARAYWLAGYQLHIHVNGDRGVNVVLDILESLQQELPRKDHATVLHHYGYSSADHAERIATLGVLVSANPFYLYAMGEKYAEIGLGPARAHYISRLGDLERNKVSVSFHSDLPMAPASPLRLAATAVNRLSVSGQVLGAEEKMSRHGALRAITIEAARAIQKDNVIGSIEVGKLADFTILESNPLLTAANAIGDTKVWGTVKQGVVHQRPNMP